MAVFVDALLIVLVIFLIARGAKRGLVLSLCGFLAVIVALFGARYAVQHLAPPLAEQIAVGVEERVIEQLETLPIADLGEQEVRNAIDEAIPEIVQSFGFYEAAANKISQLARSAIEGMAGELIPLAASETARVIAQTAAEVLVFAVVFSLILMVCKLATWLINAVFHLPLLRECNALGGAIFGGIKALLFLLLAAWLVRYAGVLIPESLVRETYVLRFMVDLVGKAGL